MLLSLSLLMSAALVATPVMEQLVAKDDNREGYVKGSAPVHTLLLPLTFSNAPEMALLVNPFLSTSGKVWADQRTNTLLIQDSRDNLDRIRQLIREFDVPAPVRGPVVIVRKVEIPGRELELTNETEQKVTDAVAPLLVPSRACFAKALSRRPELGGTFWIWLTLGTDGQVSAVRVEEARPELPEAASDCIIELFRSLRIPGVSQARVELVFGTGAQRQ